MGLASSRHRIGAPISSRKERRHRADGSGNPRSMSNGRNRRHLLSFEPPSMTFRQTCPALMAQMRVNGRSNSYFTDIVLMFAQELDCDCLRAPHTSATEPGRSGGNPPLRPRSLLERWPAGSQNLCRVLDGLADLNLSRASPRPDQGTVVPVRVLTPKYLQVRQSETSI